MNWCSAVRAEMLSHFRNGHLEHVLLCCFIMDFAKFADEVHCRWFHVLEIAAWSVLLTTWWWIWWNFSKRMLLPWDSRLFSGWMSKTQCCDHTRALTVQNMCIYTTDRDWSCMCYWLCDNIYIKEVVKGFSSLVSGESFWYFSHRGSPSLAFL